MKHSINTILVPVDFSSCSLQALNHAIGMAEYFEAKLILAHIYHIPDPDTIAYSWDSQFMDRIETRIRIEFKIIEHYNKQLKKLPVQYVIKMGFVVKDIVQIVNNEQVDLIVMGTKGTSNRLADLWGSVTTDVLAKTPCPVMVFPLDCISNLSKRVILASDLKEPISKQLQYTRELAAYYGSHIELLYVGAEDLSKEQTKTRNAILEVISSKQSQITPNYEFVHDTNVLEGIEVYLQMENPKMITLLAHHRGFFDRLFNGSILRQLTLHANTPLLVIPE